MKIAIFTDLYAPWAMGGIISSIQAQKMELERLGHEVVVFCPGFEGDSLEKNVICVPSHRLIRMNSAVMSKRPPVVERFVVKEYPDFANFDVVHVHYEASCSIAGVNLAKKFRIPLVQTMHGREDIAMDMNVPKFLQGMASGLLNLMHRRYLTGDMVVDIDDFQALTRARARMWELMVRQAEKADVVVTPSGHFADKLRHYGVQRPIVPISNGVSDDLVATNFRMRELSEGEELKMIWNSRVSNEKRIIPFLHALEKVKRPVKLYVYGDGNAERAAKKFVENKGLNVEFMSRRSRAEIMERMKEVHLGVLASYNFDTQGMVLLEAEATGLPVFLCDPELTEALPAGGYVLARPEPEAMAAALDGIDAESIAEMSEVMLKNHSQVAESTVTTKMLEVYDSARKGDSL